MDRLAVNQRAEALRHLIERECTRFEDDTGARIRDIKIGRVYEDISSVAVHLENEYGT